MKRMRGLGSWEGMDESTQTDRQTEQLEEKGERDVLSDPLL